MQDKRLLRQTRRGLKQIRQFLLPELRLRCGAVTGSLLTARDQQYTAIFDSLDLAIQHATSGGLRSSSAELIASTVA